MKKFLINLVCAFVPNDARRRKLRRRLRGEKQISIQNIWDLCHNELGEIKNHIGQIYTHFEPRFNQISGQLNNPIATPEWINRNIEKKLSTALMHQKTFLPFKAIHSGQDIVMVATGPSLNDFQLIDNAIYIGVNTSFLMDRIKLDYLFAQDYLEIGRAHV